MLGALDYRDPRFGDFASAATDDDDDEEDEDNEEEGELDKADSVRSLLHWVKELPTLSARNHATPRLEEISNTAQLALLALMAVASESPRDPSIARTRV